MVARLLADVHFHQPISAGCAAFFNHLRTPDSVMTLPPRTKKQWEGRETALWFCEYPIAVTDTLAVDYLFRCTGGDAAVTSNAGRDEEYAERVCSTRKQQEPIAISGVRPVRYRPVVHSTRGLRRGAGRSRAWIEPGGVVRCVLKMGDPDGSGSVSCRDVGGVDLSGERCKRRKMQVGLLCVCLVAIPANPVPVWDQPIPLGYHIQKELHYMTHVIGARLSHALVPWGVIPGP